MAQEQRIIKGFNTEAGLGIYDYDSLANKPNIEGMIQDALEEFVPPVDNTLMNDGQAADAKVTGEAISRLESRIGSDPVSEQIEQAISEIPPNQPLSFEGAVEATYNGSAPIAVAIPIIDDSLEVEGNAADAKATGEAIGAVLKKMDEEIGSATKTYVDEKFDNIEIPEIPEFSGFIAQPEAPTQYNVLWIDTNDESIDSEIGNIEQIDAWTLQGKLPSYFASKEFVQKEIADAQLDDKEVDLSSYYTKSEVDSKIENIQLKEGPQGEPGVSGVWVGVDEPVDDDYQVWINPEGSAYKELQRPIVEHETGSAIGLNDASDMKLAGLKLYGKTIQNGIPTPDAPVALESVGDGGSVGMSVSNKNMLKFPYYELSRGGNNYISAGGVTFITNDDGSITFSGTNTGSTGTSAEYLFTFNTGENRLWLPIGTYTVSTGVEPFTESKWYLMVGMYSGTIDGTSKSIRGGSAQFTVTEPGYAFIVLRLNSGKTADNVTVYPQIEIGSVATKYEKPIAHQTAVIPTPNGLPGIPVASGGNYTDENGQQWACDEVDFEKGVYVQNVYKEKLTKAYAAWDTSIACEISKVPYYGAGTGNPQLCSHMPVITYGQLGSVTGIAMYSINGAGYCAISKKDFSTVAECQEWLDANEVYVVYRLLNPIYHNLSDIDPDALTQYATLHTNYPNTTIFNDAGAGMEVKYAADTKLYIDQKFDQLAQAMLNQ